MVKKESAKPAPEQKTETRREQARGKTAEAVSAEETPQASSLSAARPSSRTGGFRRFMVKLLVLAVLAGAGYGLWKNLGLLEQLKSAFDRAPKEDVYQQQINTLNVRLRQLQQQLASVSARVREPDLSGIEARIDGIEKINLNVIDSKADVATVLGVVTRMDKAEQKLDRLATVTDDSALILTGVMLVKDSAERGGSFEYEAEVLNNIVADNPQMRQKAARLGEFARKGILSERELVREFEKIYANLLKEQKSDFDKTWKERLNSKLNEIVQIKKVNAEAPEFSADKSLQAVRQEVDEGRLAAAANMLLLPENQEWMKNAALQAWVKDVRIREEFYGIIRSMSASSLAVMKVNFLKKGSI